MNEQPSVDTRNMILAVVLAALILFGWPIAQEYFFPAPKPTAEEVAAKKQAEEKAKKDAEQAEKAKQAAARADNCKRAQQAKAMFDTGKAVRMPNEKGEMVYIDANKRAEEQQRINDAIANNC